jgi:dihydropyrimidinase
LAGCRLYVVHVSTREGVAAISAARRAGQSVTAETCPHYLVLDDWEYERPGFEGAAYVMSPPLRSPADRSALWKGLRRGAVQVVGTDHCPFDRRQKELGLADFRKIPNGIAGIEDRLKLLYTRGVAAGKLSVGRFVGVTATLPAKIFGLYPRKGTLAAGSDADVVVWDPRAESASSAARQRQRCDTNVYEGVHTVGEPKFVLQRGRVAVEEGRVLAVRGSGRYLHRGLGQTV